MPRLQMVFDRLGGKGRASFFVIQTGLAHILIASGILMAVVTGVDNIYTAPEFFSKQNGRNLTDVFLHGVAALVPLISWAIGSTILFVTRRIKPAWPDS